MLLEELVLFNKWFVRVIFKEVKDSALISLTAASGPPPTNRCCDSGRPLFTDPTTGQTICSCQHEQMLNYQRIAQASLMGPGGMPLSMYNSAAYAEGLPAAAYMPGVGPEQFHYVS